MSYTVAQNTSFLTAASVGQKFISFGYFLVIARLIGAENTGVYFFAIAFTTIFSMIADFGLSPVLTREIAKSPDNAKEYFRAVLGIKFFSALCAYGLLILSAYALGYPQITRNLIILSGVTMLFDNLHISFYAFFKARKNLTFEAFGMVGSQLLTLIIGSVALWQKWPLIWLIAAYTIPSAGNALYAGICLRRQEKVTFWPKWDRGVVKIFLIAAIPFALANILNRLYSYTDSILMSKLLTARELGWWSLPYKITFAFQFIPIALASSIYPVFSELYSAQKEKIFPLFEKGWRYLFAVSFPLVFGIAAIAPGFITKFYGVEYAPSVPVLQVLLFSMIFVFLHYVSGAFLNASGRQRLQTITVAVALLVSLSGNLILLPRIGIMGAAFSSLISSLVMFVLGFWFVRRVLAVDIRVIFQRFNQTFWPAAIMGAAVYFISARFSFIAAIPCGAIIYAALLFVFGFWNKQTVLTIRAKVFPPSV